MADKLRAHLLYHSQVVSVLGQRCLALGPLQKAGVGGEGSTFLSLGELEYDFSFTVPMVTIQKTSAKTMPCPL